jgi:hypothetical protein
VLERLIGEGWEQEDDRQHPPDAGAFHEPIARRKESGPLEPGKTRLYSVDSRQKIVGAAWRRHRAEGPAQAYARSSASAKPAVVSVAATGHPRTKPKNGPKSRVAGKPDTKSPGTLDWK